MVVMLVRIWYVYWKGKKNSVLDHHVLNIFCSKNLYFPYKATSSKSKFVEYKMLLLKLDHVLGQK